MIEAVIFDMDGLIIDSEPFWRKAEMEIFATVGVHLSENDCRKTMGFRLNETIDYWYKKKPWTGMTKKEMESEILSEVKKLIEAKGEALPGVLDTLKMCTWRGLKMAIASSSPMMLIEATIKKLNIEHYFTTIESAEFVEYGKPHPSLFMHTASALSTACENCLVLEDSFHGVIAGLAAKMSVIAVPEIKSIKFDAANLVLDQLDPSKVKTFIDLY